MSLDQDVGRGKLRNDWNTVGNKRKINKVSLILIWSSALRSEFGREDGRMDLRKP